MKKTTGCVTYYYFPADRESTEMDTQTVSLSDIRAPWHRDPIYIPRPSRAGRRGESVCRERVRERMRGKDRSAIQGSRGTRIDCKSNKGGQLP